MQASSYATRQPFSARPRAGKKRRNKKIFLCSLLVALVVVMASFRAPGADQLALEYSVSGPVAAIQNLSLYILGASMVLFILLIPKKNPLLRRPVLSKLVVFYFIFQLVSILTSFYYKGDFNGFILDLVFLLVIACFFGFAIKRFTFDLSSPTSIFPYFFIGLMAFLVINLVVEYGGLGNTIWKGRMQGVTGHPNFLGLCAGLGAVSAFSLLLATKIKKYKIAFAGALVMSIALIILTLSRTAMVATIAGCGFVLSCHITNVSTRIIMLLGGVVLLAVVFSVGLESLDYADRGNTREGTWKKLISVVSTVPVVGEDPESLPTSNSYLFAFASTGLFGFVFFILAIIALLSKSVKVAFSYSVDKVRKVQYSAIAGMGAYLCVAAVFEGLLLDTVSIPVLTFWAVLSFSTDLKFQKRARMVPIRPRPLTT